MNHPTSLKTSLVRWGSKGFCHMVNHSQNYPNFRISSIKYAKFKIINMLTVFITTIWIFFLGHNCFIVISVIQEQLLHNSECSNFLSFSQIEQRLKFYNVKCPKCGNTITVWYLCYFLFSMTETHIDVTDVHEMLEKKSYINSDNKVFCL